MIKIAEVFLIGALAQQPMAFHDQVSVKALETLFIFLEKAAPGYEFVLRHTSSKWNEGWERLPFQFKDFAIYGRKREASA